MNALGCYIFAGGFSIGLRDAGFDVLGHLEAGPYGVATFQRNFDRPVIQAPQLWHEAKRWAPKGKIDLMYCNPPCAAWSVVGRHRGTDDARVGCTRAAVAAGIMLRPTIWAWESVTQAWTHGNDFVRWMADQWMAEGYHVKLVFVNLLDHGAAQTRQRVFMVASRVEIDLSPTPRRRVLTAGDVIEQLGDPGHVPPLSAAWQRWLPETPPGARVYEAFQAAMGDDAPRRTFSTGRSVVIGRPNYLCHRIRADAPVGAFTGMPNHVHYAHDRLLGHREVMNLSGWPLSYELEGRPTSWQAQIAQAVQPPVARWLGLRARAALEAGHRVSRKVPPLEVIETRHKKVYKPETA